MPEPVAPGTAVTASSPAVPVPAARRARLALPRADRREIAAIFAGGALGTLARAALAEAFPHSATAWPWPTFAVNIVAAFLLGYFVTRLQERLPLSSYRRPLLGTGLCGGLSTFSTMQVELLKMISAGAWGGAGPTYRSAAVNEDAVKLTSYFGERQRVAGGGFAADALLDLYGRHQLATSILLRGVEGFGPRQRLRTDFSLTLSEDLPLIVVAVDARSRIEKVIDPTARLIGSGIVTLERARLLRDEIPPATLADGPDEETKLTLYLGRQERVHRVPAFVAVCDLLHRRGIAGATVLLGVDGTAHGKRERAAFFSRNARTPMMVIAVGSGARIGRLLPELGGLLRRPLLTLERVRICKRDGTLLCAPSALPGTDETGRPLWHKLMVYTSEAALHDGQPIHRAIVRRLRAAGLAGATTQRGVWGFHGDHAPHGDRLLQLGRRVPAVTVAIDAPERIAAAFEIIDSLTTEEGLVTSETVPAIRLAGGAELSKGSLAGG